MYKNAFVVYVKTDGSILRENEGIVTLPFNSTYVIGLKNLNNVKAKVDVMIDGKSALRDGRKILVSPNEVVELEGFKEDSKVKYKFKFVEKTKDIKDHIGDNIEDGIIKVVVQYEKRFEMPIFRDWIPYYKEPLDSDYYTTKR